MKWVTHTLLHPQIILKESDKVVVLFKILYMKAPGVKKGTLYVCREILEMSSVHTGDLFMHLDCQDCIDQCLCGVIFILSGKEYHIYFIYISVKLYIKCISVILLVY